MLYKYYAVFTHEPSAHLGEGMCSSSLEEYLSGSLSLTWALKSAQAIETRAVVRKQQQQSVQGDMVTAEGGRHLIEAANKQIVFSPPHIYIATHMCFLYGCFRRIITVY